MEANPHNYDVWFDYVRLMEEEGSVEQTRELYERAVANVPPVKVISRLAFLYFIFMNTY